MVNLMAEAMFDSFPNGAGTAVPLSWKGLSEEQRKPWRDQAVAGLRAAGKALPEMIEAGRLTALEVGEDLDPDDIDAIWQAMIGTAEASY